MSISKKCPYCGLYETEFATGECAKRAARNTGKVIIAITGGMVVRVFSPRDGGPAGKKILDNLNPEKVKVYYCRKCKKFF